MGLWDSINRGLGALGDFAGDVFGQVLPQVAGGLLGQILPGPGPIVGFNPNAPPITFGAPARGRERLLAGTAPPRIGAPTSSPLDFLPGFNGTTGGIMPALPGGAPIQQASLGGNIFSGILGGLGSSALGLFDSGPSLPALPGVAPGGIFQATPARLRARPLFHITNPSTGREVWYRNIGQPILWSGDLRSCKRVDRIARRARRVSRKR